MSTRFRFHIERAEGFKRRASNTRSPRTREMYLHLAEVEIALAAREDALDERLERLTPEKAEVPAITGQANET